MPSRACRSRSRRWPPPASTGSRSMPGVSSVGCRSSGSRSRSICWRTWSTTSRNPMTPTWGQVEEFVTRDERGDPVLPGQPAAGQRLQRPDLSAPPPAALAGGRHHPPTIERRARGAAGTPVVPLSALATLQRGLGILASRGRPGRRRLRQHRGGRILRTGDHGGPTTPQTDRRPGGRAPRGDGGCAEPVRRVHGGGRRPTARPVG